MRLIVQTIASADVFTIKAGLAACQAKVRPVELFSLTPKEVLVKEVKNREYTDVTINAHKNDRYPTK
jgi:hypothetical protein